MTLVKQIRKQASVLTTYISYSFCFERVEFHSSLLDEQVFLVSAEADPTPFKTK
jgi:hypothetical protein